MERENIREFDEWDFMKRLSFGLVKTEFPQILYNICESLKHKLLNYE